MSQSNEPFRGWAVDIGNSAVHVGWFDGAASAAGIPAPCEVIVLDATDVNYRRLEQHLRSVAGDQACWWIASVNHKLQTRFEAWLGQFTSPAEIHSLDHQQMPLVVDVEYPDRVGVDRLLAAVAANRLRAPVSPAIVIDAGTAITVDVVNAEGVFLGGAILPGMRMSAQALDHYTERLPCVDTDKINGPSAIGRNTQQAIESGIYWGVVGAAAELINQVANSLGQLPQVFLTGGDGARLASRVVSAKFIPHLVLSGIAISAASLEQARVR